MFAAEFSLTQLFTGPLEFFAFITSIACVWLITIKKPHRVGIGNWTLFHFDFNWNWPIGIITSVLYFFIFWKYHLWMNAILQIFYVLSGFWGWYRWLKGFDKKDEIPIKRFDTPKRKPENGWGYAQHALTGFCIVALVAIYYAAIVHFKDAAPFWDSVLFAMSVVAQFVRTGKSKEHWKLWFVEDIIAVFVFWNLGLGATSVLYGLFAINAVRGMVTWRQMEAAEHQGRMSRYADSDGRA